MFTYTFFTTSLILVLIPGTGVIYTLSNGLLRGPRQSIAAAFGCTIGILPHLLLGILSLTIFNGVNDVFLTIIKIMGSLYLLYLGINMIKKQDIDLTNTASSDKGLLKTAADGAAINLLNPKLTIFFLAFIPQFVNDIYVSITLHAIVLGLTFMLITLVVFILYGLLASSVLKVLRTDPKALQISYKVFGIIFILLALQLGLSHLR